MKTGMVRPAQALGHRYAIPARRDPRAQGPAWELASLLAKEGVRAKGSFSAQVFLGFLVYPS